MATDTRIPPMERAGVLLQPVGRWTAGRKARLLDAIGLGIVTEDAVARAHRLHADEIDAWRRQRARAGVAALRMGAIISATRKV